ncbi:MAG: acyl--CoA ligase [Bdellovibrionales bacterium]|nr:acyl--CoA ligase [Bdellovibrionales bacterium]
MKINESLTQYLVFDKINKHGGLPALQVDEVSCTYAQLSDMISVFTDYLLKADIKPQDRILIQLPKSAEYVVCFLGILSIGAIAVPIDPNSSSERQSYVAHETSARIFITNEAVEFVGCPTMNVQVNLGMAEVIVQWSGALVGPVGSIATLSLEDTAAIIFSSGSTGRPKGVALRHRHLLAVAENLAIAADMKLGHRELILSPMCHTDGWHRVASTLLSTGCVVIFNGLLTIPTFLEFLVKYKVNGFYTPPPFVRYLLMGPAEKIRAASTSLQSVEIGSAAISPQEISELIKLFPGAKFLVHFGLTESSRATILDCKKNPEKLHTVGKAPNGVEVLIADEFGKPVNYGVKGEILLRGSQCTDTYWNRQDLNNIAFRNAWLRTGDYGILDQEGFLTYCGRKDDMINSGGFHFFPAEVEVELGPVPGLKRYLISGLPDTKGILGQIPVIFAVPEDSSTWSVEKFFKLAQRRLPAFKIPKRIIIVPDIVMTSSGKPDRQKTVLKYGG